jgi:hypothetical protein
MAEIPCTACARRVADPGSPGWRDLLAVVDLGHDQVAHRIYFAVIQRGIDAAGLARMTAGQLLAWPNFGVGMIERLRSAMPEPSLVDARTGLKPCGTSAAYRRHRRDGEEPCHACREAEALRSRGGRPRIPLQPCGTRAAYIRHVKRGEEPCADCRIANATYAEDKRRERSARDRAQVPHGLSGYLNWACRCKACCAAGAERNRAYRDRKLQEQLAVADGS